MSEISIGGKPGALLLGPLVVAPEYTDQGYGRALVTEALAAARAAGLVLVVLVGDEPYYGRFGFKPVAPGTITFPGPVNPKRILALELADGALARFSGLISAP
jgi:predicted N-acetyltransferase YhbS